MFGMSIYALGTATIAVTSSTPEQIMAARSLNYVYVGIELAVVPTFQSEIGAFLNISICMIDPESDMLLVPTPARGFMVGSYQLSIILGGLVINPVCFGTSSLPDNRAWRIPLGLFYVVPTIVAALVLFVPESPCWLLRQDRADEALVCLRKYREGIHTEEEILAEFAQLKASLDNEPEQGKFVELFHGNNLKRTGIVIGTNFFMQASGQAFASQYSAVYVRSLTTINPFGYQLINAAINIVTLLCSLLWSDIVGRRYISRKKCPGASYD
jgi:MFS family permease